MQAVYGIQKEKQILKNWNEYRRATKLKPELSKRSYSDRLKVFNLPTLK